MDEGDREWTEQQEGDREWTEPPLCVPTLAAAARAKSVHRYGAWEAATAACCPAWALVGADVPQVVLLVLLQVLLQGAGVLPALLLLEVVLPARCWYRSQKARAAWYNAASSLRAGLLPTGPCSLIHAKTAHADSYLSGSRHRGWRHLWNASQPSVVEFLIPVSYWRSCATARTRFL